MIELRGQTFGKLTAIEPTLERQHGNVVWRCRCSCGKEVNVNVNRLKVGGTKSCGCLNHQPLDGSRQRSPCSAPGCDNLSRHLGYCDKHYYRFKRYGSMNLPKRIKRLCSVDGCNRQARAIGLCNMHRCRLRTQGDPGEASPRKGNGGTGTIGRSGYRYFYRPNHPNAAKNGTVAEHVLVMSALIGRPLRKGESVHHRNGVRSDNSPHNLELRTTAHPQGQTLQDMIRFCEQYLEDYGPVWDILKQISSLPPTPPGQ